MMMELERTSGRVKPIENLTLNLLCDHISMTSDV